jgi:CRP/FNR family transcriptional regulator, cyclic AMP receptor protein
MLGSAVNAWLVPALVVLLLGGTIWFGLRWARSEHLGALAAIPLFSHLSRNRLLSILRSTKPVEFPAGAVIVREGEAGTGFYVITKGTASVSVGGLERATLTSGAYFGEVSVIDGGPRSATITATTPVSTLELTSAALRSVLDREPDVAASIGEQLREWLTVAGAPSTEAMTGPVDRATLVELCRELRKIEHPEWTQAEPPRRRLRDVFAGS